MKPPLVVIPGNGNKSRVQTFDIACSIRILSPRSGAKIGIRLVVDRECERLNDVGAFLGISITSLRDCVSLIMTRQGLVGGLTLEAR